MQPNPPLTNLQMELLKLFALDLSDAELMDLKQVLAHHFADRLIRQAAQIWEEKGLTQSDMVRWLNDDAQ